MCLEIIDWVPLGEALALASMETVGWRESVRIKAGGEYT